MNPTTLKQTSAWLPIAMSFAALAILLVHITFFGIAREADEGTSAHLFQILMAGQAPVVAFFAIRWLPKNPLQGLRVLALQAMATLVALAPVYFLHV